jgi:hypothetical protein
MTCAVPSARQEDFPLNVSPLPAVGEQCIIFLFIYLFFFFF